MFHLHSKRFLPPQGLLKAVLVIRIKRAGIERFNTIFQAIALMKWFCFDKGPEDVYY